MIGANHHQAREFALRAGVRLQRNGRESGDFAQRLLELFENLLIARRLLDGHERMEFPELGPRDGQHFRRRVQLHGAGAERDHRRIEADVLTFQRRGCSASSAFPNDGC